MTATDVRDVAKRIKATPFECIGPIKEPATVMLEALARVIEKTQSCPPMEFRGHDPANLPSERYGYGQALADVRAIIEGKP